MISVVCAVIIHEGKILATQRSTSMSLPTLWEFPGGKAEAGETLEQALKREILEELAIEIEIQKPLTRVEHKYETFQIQLIPYLCKYTLGTINLSEHMAYKWLIPSELHSLTWASADLPIVEEVIQMFTLS